MKTSKKIIRLANNRKKTVKTNFIILIFFVAIFISSAVIPAVSAAIIYCGKLNHTVGCNGDVSYLLESK